MKTVRELEVELDETRAAIKKADGIYQSALRAARVAQAEVARLITLEEEAYARWDYARYQTTLGREASPTTSVNPLLWWAQHGVF
jgi:hypothetical protein